MFLHFFFAWFIKSMRQSANKHKNNNKTATKDLHKQRKEWVKLFASKRSKHKLLQHLPMTNKLFTTHGICCFYTASNLYVYERNIICPFVMWNSRHLILCRGFPDKTQQLLHFGHFVFRALGFLLKQTEKNSTSDTITQLACNNWNKMAASENCRQS